METLADIGRYGGEVLRNLTLLGNSFKPEEEIEGAELMKVPVRNRRALRDSGMMRFFEKPRGKVKAATKTPKLKSLIKKGVKASFMDEAGKKINGIVSRIDRKNGFGWIKVGDTSYKLPLSSITV